MPAKNRITVTEEVIARACVRDSRHCMVAEAIKAAKPEWHSISVDLATIRWTNPRTRQRYTALTPDGIRNAIFHFDQGEPVEPFAFTLKAVHHIRSSAGTKQGTPERAAATTERTRQRRNPKVRLDGDGQPVIHGGPSLPRGHMGGAANPVQPTQVEVTGEEGNIKLSGGRYRQYGLRQLRA